MSPNRKNRTLAIETLDRREMMSAAPWSAPDVVADAVPAAVAAADPAASSTTTNRALAETQNLYAYPAPPINVSLNKGVLAIRALEAEHQVIVKPVNGQLLIRTTLWHGNGMYEDRWVPQSAVSKIEYYGTSGRDIFVNGTNLESTARGYGEWDIFEGGSARDVFYGGDGPDNLKGRGGNDELFGDIGIDTLYGEAGRDVLHGGADTDYLYGGDERDVLLGDTGVDVYDGQAGVDTIYAEPSDYFKNFDRTDVIIRPTFLSLDPQGSTLKSEGARGAITTYLFKVTRSGDLSGTTSVAYSVTGYSSNPATASDFVGGVMPSGIVTFARNETTKYIAIKVAGDAIAEGDERFTVTLAKAALPATIIKGSVDARIYNDDPALRTLADNRLTESPDLQSSHAEAVSIIPGSPAVAAAAKPVAAPVGAGSRGNEASRGNDVRRNLSTDRPSANAAIDAVFTAIGSEIPNGLTSTLSIRLPKLG